MSKYDTLTSKYRGMVPILVEKSRLPPRFKTILERENRSRSQRSKGVKEKVLDTGYELLGFNGPSVSESNLAVATNLCFKLREIESVSQCSFSIPISKNCNKTNKLRGTRRR